MKVGTFRGQTSYTTNPIESAVEKLVLNVKCKGLADLAKVKVTVNLNLNGAGTRTIIPSLPLSHLLEIAANNAGFVLVTPAGVNAPDGEALYFVKGTIELANQLAIDVSGGYVEVQLTDCAEYQEFNLNTLNNPTRSTSFIEYRTEFCNPDSTKEFSLDGAYQLCVPKEVKQLDITFVNGANVVYTPEELEAIAFEHNELSVLSQIDPATGCGVLPGLVDFFPLGLNGAISARVLLSGVLTGKNCYVVRNSDISAL